MRTFLELIDRVEFNKTLLISLEGSYRGKNRGKAYLLRYLTLTNSIKDLNKKIDNYNKQFTYTYSGTMSYPFNKEILGKYEITLKEDSIENATAIIEHISKGKIQTILKTINKIGLLISK